MDLLTRLEAERACEALVQDYACFLDDYAYDDFLNLWSHQPSLQMLGREHASAEAIRAWLEARERGMICRHLVTNIRIEVLSSTEARGRCYTLAFRAGEAMHNPPGPMSTPTFLVSYRDHFVREAERGWRISRREVIPDLVGPDQMRALYLSSRG